MPEEVHPHPLQPGRLGCALEGSPRVADRTEDEAVGSLFLLERCENLDGAIGQHVRPGLAALGQAATMRGHHPQALSRNVDVAPSEACELRLLNPVSTAVSTTGRQRAGRARRTRDS